jgi:hypothetical protein
MLFFALLFPLLAHALEPLPVIAPVTVPVPPSAAPAKVIDPEAVCEEAEKKLSLYSLSYRVYCSHDKDCEVYQISHSPCAAPMVLRKSAEVARDKQLKVFQTKSAELCAAAWAKAPTCTRAKPRPVCREGKCVDGGSLPGSVK